MASMIEYGYATRPFPGQEANGDQVFVRVSSPDHALFVLFDGLGHGEEAEKASHIAVATLEAHFKEGLGISAYLLHCHAALSGTRGACAVAAAVDLEARELSWLAVGDIHGVMFTSCEAGNITKKTPNRQPGVLGVSIRPNSLHPRVVTVGPGDLLVLATDGISSRFPDQISPCDTKPVQDIADNILDYSSRGTDDASVLAVRL